MSGKAHTLRPYQVDALNSIRDGLVHGSNRLLMKMPTGCGKTRTFSELLLWLKDWLAQFPEQHRKMLVVAHREELIDQAAAAVQAANPGAMVMVEQAERRASVYADIIVASIQTLSASKFARLKRLTTRTTFRVVVADESHHIVSPTWRTAMVHLGFLPAADASDKQDVEAATHDDVEAMTRNLSAWDQIAPQDRVLVGVTATPNRADAVGLGAVFQSIAYSYDLKQAIEDGWLVPIVPWAIDTNVSLDGVRINRGDFNQRDLSDTVNNPERNALALAAWLAHGGRASTIGFTVDVAHAHELARVFEAGGVRAMAVSGETPKDDRRTILRQFADGQIEAVMNCQLITEGVDLPRAACILMAKPTKSATLYEQCLDAETEVLTEDGWKGIDDTIDGPVAAYDVDSGQIHWSAADRVERLLGEEDMYGIASPHLNIRVTGGHRMVIRTRNTERMFREAAALPSECRLPMCGVQDTGEAAIADCDLAFLGLVMTDGNVSQQTNGISLFQSDANPEVVQLIERTLIACGFKFTHSLGRPPSNFGPRVHDLHRWTISFGPPRGRDSHLSGWGRLLAWLDMRPKRSRRLTPLYQTLSVRQFRVFLHAMNEGDGSKRVGLPWVTWTQTIHMYPTFADQVQSLCVRRGLRCNKSAQVGRLVTLHISNDPDWSLKTASSDSRPVWALMPSTPTERVWCVSVDTGAIITRRAGKVVIVGNCVGRGLRLFPGKTECVVIDLVDVARRHSLQTAPVLYGLPPTLTVKGKKLSEVADGFEAMLSEHPGLDVEAELANGRLTLEQLGARASLVNVWAVPTLGDFGEGRIVQWLKIGDDTYRVTYPWADGSETVEVSKDLIGQWEVVATTKPQDGGPRRQRTLASQIPSAVNGAAIAEAFIERERRSVLRLAGVDAPWKQRPATPKQIGFLRTLGVTQVPKGCTMGHASQLIELAKARRAR